MHEFNQTSSDSLSPTLVEDFFESIKIGDLESVQDYLIRTPRLLICLQAVTGFSALNAATIYEHEHLVDFFLAQNIPLNIGLFFDAEYFANFHKKSTIKKRIEQAKRSQVDISAAAMAPNEEEASRTAGQESLKSTLLSYEIGEEKQRFIILLDTPSTNPQKIIEILIQYPNFINTSGTNGLTALHIAALKGDLHFIQFLLNNKGTLNEQDRSGNTPLHLAARNGCDEAVHYLIKSGANLDIKNTEGKIAAEIARDNKHLDLSRKIIESIQPSSSMLFAVNSITPSIFHDPGKDNSSAQKLFKHDLKRQEEYIGAILTLKKILQFILEFSDNSGEVGYMKAKIIYMQFPIIYTDLEHKNPVDFDLLNIIAESSSLECQRRLIIYFTETLMNIIYKCGRQNFEKEPMHIHCRYLIHKGLINYIMELKRNPSLMSTDIFKAVLQEIKQEFPVIIEFFLLNQLKQPINDTIGLYNKLVADVTKLTLKMDKIKLAVINNVMSKKPSDFPEEPTLKLSEDKLLAQKLENYRSLQEHLISGKIKLTEPTIEDIEGIIRLMEDYLKLKLERKALEDKKNELEKKDRYWRQDIVYMQAFEKKTKKIRVMREEMEEGENRAASIAPLEKEIANYRILSAEEITAQEAYFESQEELVHELKKELEKLQPQKAQMSKSLLSTKNRIKKGTGNVEWFKQELLREEAEFKAFEHEIALKETQLAELKTQLVLLKSRTDSQFELFRLQQQPISIDEKIKQMMQNSHELEEVKAKFNELQRIKQVIFLVTRKELSVKNAELDELVNEYKQLQALEQKRTELQYQLPNLKLIAQITHINCQALRNYQHDYENRHLRHLLIDFEKQVTLAETSIEKIGVLTDFCRWWHEGCSEDLKKQIQTVLPRYSITRIRDLRNKIMHCLDWTHSSQWLINERQVFNDATVALGIIIKNLLLNSDYFIRQTTFIEMPEIEHKQCLNLLEKAIRQLPPIPAVRRDDSGREMPPSSADQVDIFINSVNTGKAILRLIVTELTKEAEAGINLETISKSFNQHYDLSCLSPSEEKILRIRWKYDGLLQALGETLGNLQQYKELIPDIGNLNIPLNDTFIPLHDFVPLAKEYRSVRTHTLYQNLKLTKILLRIIEQHNKLLFDQLNQLFNLVKDGYKNSNNVIIRQLLIKFDDAYSPESNNTECKFM